MLPTPVSLCPSRATNPTFAAARPACHPAGTGNGTTDGTEGRAEISRATLDATEPGSAAPADAADITTFAATLAATLIVGTSTTRIGTSETSSNTRADVRRRAREPRTGCAASSIGSASVTEAIGTAAARITLGTEGAGPRSTGTAIAETDTGTGTVEAARVRA
jgi:hypothetical protein